jgi:hypothetical protein
MAHESDPEDVYYHKDWTRALSHTGNVREARLQRKTIIQKRPDIRSVYVDEFYDDLNESDSAVKDLGAGRLPSEPPEEVLSRVRVSMGQWLHMEDGSYRTFSRAMSGLGKRFNILARVSMLESRYSEDSHGPREGVAASLCDAIYLIGESSEYLDAGEKQASSQNIAEQIRHAAGMRRDLMSDNITILKTVAAKFAEGGYCIPGRMERVQAAIRKISVSLKGLDVGFATDMEVVLRWLSNYCEAQKRGEKAFKNALLKCGERDIEDPETFFRIAREAIVADIFSVNGPLGVSPQLGREAAFRMAEAICARYRKAHSLDSLSLAIIFIRFNLLGKEEPTPQNIRKELALVGVQDAGNGMRHEARVANLNKWLSLGIATAASGEREYAYEQKPAPEAIMLDRDMLKKSIDTSDARSIVSRFRRLKDLSVKLAPWGDATAESQRYFTTDISHGIDMLESRVNHYSKSVTDYLDKEHQKGLSRDEKSRLRSIGTELATQYAALKSEMSVRERLADKRVIRITTGIVYDTMVGIKSRLANYYFKYGGLGSEYLDSQMDLLNGYLDELTMVQDEGERGYLSYDAFAAIVDKIEAVMAEMNVFSAKLDTYRPYLENIRAGINEAQMHTALLGRSDMVDEYTERLTEAKSRIMRYARDGITAGEIPDDIAEFYLTIAKRTALLSEIRNTMVTAIDKAIKDLTAAGAAGEAERRNEMRKELMALLKGNLYAGSEPNSIVRRLCNIIDPAIPLNDEVRLLTDKIRSLMKIVADTGNLAAPVFWQATELNFRVISRTVPGSVTEEQIDRFSGHALRIREIREAIKKLRLYDTDFTPEITALISRIRIEADGVQKLIAEVYTKWNRAIGERIELLKVLLSAYLRSWKINGGSESAITEIESGISSLVNSISSGFNSEGNAPDIAALLKRARSPFAKLAKLNVFDIAYSNDISVLKGGLIIRDFRKFFPVNSYAGIEADYDSLQTLYYIDRDASGKPQRLNMMIFSKKPGDTRYYEISAPGVDCGTVDSTGEFIAASESIVGKLESAETSADQRFEGIRLSPSQFLFFIDTALNFYASCRMNGARLGGMGLGDIKSIELTDIMSGSLLESQGTFVSSLLNSSKADDLIVIAALKKEMELDGIAAGSDHERELAAKALSGKIKVYMDGTADILCYGYYDMQRVAAFIRNTTLFMNKVTGSEHPVPDVPTAWRNKPRLFLTMPEGGGKGISSIYPPVKRYSGVYFDTAKARFAVRNGYETAAAIELCDSLNMALGAYLDAAAVAGEMPRVVSEVIAGIRKRAEIGVVVSKDVPTRNSMSVTGTMIFDKDFIEYVTRPSVYDAARNIILGERIFHELGLISTAQKSEAEDIRHTIQKEEEEQLYRDVIIYAIIFSANPSLRKSVEEYTDMTLKDSVTGEIAKFSKVFGTKGLYRNIQKWAEEVAEFPEKVKGEIKIFVRDFLDRVNITSRFVRFFPAEPAAKSPKTYSDAMALAIHRAAALKDEEAQILDNIGSKDAGFFTKTRRVVISSALIPECQKGVISEINKRSAEAFAAGLTKDLIEIKPLDYIQSVKSGEAEESVVILEESEAQLYSGGEARLVFKTDKVDPILINGLVAAGRAVVYGEMESLRRILMKLGHLPDTALPSAMELERILREDKLRRLPVIFLPPVKVLTSEIGELNRAILKLMQYA